jgi:hypothetical protein
MTRLLKGNFSWEVTHSIVSSPTCKRCNNKEVTASHIALGYKVLADLILLFSMPFHATEWLPNIQKKSAQQIMASHSQGLSWPTPLILSKNLIWSLSHKSRFNYPVIWPRHPASKWGVLTSNVINTEKVFTSLELFLLKYSSIKHVS